MSLVGFLLVLRAFLAWLQTLPGMSRTAVVFSGLLFGLHPLSVESVAWISSQGDLGAAGCVFLSLRANWEFEAEDRPEGVVLRSCPRHDGVPHAANDSSARPLSPSRRRRRARSRS